MQQAALPGQGDLHYIYEIRKKKRKREELRIKGTKKGGKVNLIKYVLPRLHHQPLQGSRLLKLHQQPLQGSRHFNYFNSRFSLVLQLVTIYALILSNIVNTTKLFLR